MAFASLAGPVQTGQTSQTGQGEEESRVKVTHPSVKPLVRGGSGRGSWRVVPSTREDEGGRSEPTAIATVEIKYCPKSSIHR